MKFSIFKRGMNKKKPVAVESLAFKAEPLVAAVKGNVLDKYAIDQASVFIVDNEGKGYYLISEPDLTPDEQRIYSLLMEYLYFSLKPVEKVEEPMKYVEGFIWEAAEDLGVVKQVQDAFQKYKYFITRDAFGYGPLHAPMMDDDVEEVSATGYGKPVTVIHRRFTEYDWLDTNVVFPSEDSLRNFVQRMAQKAGKSVTSAIPFTDAMTREGHRLAVTFADEVTLPGSTLAIRKFPENPLSMAHLLSFGTLTPLMAAYLWLFVEYKGYIMILGPLSSGKTTFLNGLLTMINPVLKIGTIEDTPELKIPHSSWQRFKARHTFSITESRFDVDLMDLVKLSLRYRPDYIVVGEVRGEEVRALTQASAVGHGALTTFHSESPEAALVRLRSPPMEVLEGGLMLIWAFVTLNRVKTEEGKVVRRVMEITEVEPKDGHLALKPIFTWNARSDSFSPINATDVIRKSYRLKTVMRLTGMTEAEIASEMERRARYLTEVVEKGKLSYPEFSEAIRQFYTSRLKEAKR